MDWRDALSICKDHFTGEQLEQVTGASEEQMVSWQRFGSPPQDIQHKLTTLATCAEKLGPTIEGEFSDYFTAERSELTGTLLQAIAAGRYDAVEQFANRQAEQKATA